MNFLSSPLITDKALAYSFQKRYLDIGSLMNLSSASRQTFQVYRDALMERIAELFSLKIEMKRDLSFQNEVIISLTTKLVVETPHITLQLLAKKGQKKYLQTCDPLSIRHFLYARITTLCKRNKIIKCFQSNDENHIYFLLSCARRLLKVEPQNPNYRLFFFKVIASCFQWGCVDKRFLDGWNFLTSEWKNMEANEQAKFLVEISNRLGNEKTFKVLQLLRVFTLDTSGWVSEAMRLGFYWMLENPNSNDKWQQIYRILVSISQTYSYANFKPVLTVYDALLETLNADLYDDFANIEPLVVTRQLRAELEYLKHNLAKMSAREQVIVVRKISQDLARDSELRTEAALLLTDETLAWAHFAIPKAIIFTSKYDLLGENARSLGFQATASLKILLKLLSKTSPTVTRIINIHCDAMFSLFNCRTKIALECALSVHRSRLLSALKDIWHTLTPIGQIRELTNLAILINEAILRDEFLEFRVFLQDNALVWEYPIMRDGLLYLLDLKEHNSMLPRTPQYKNTCKLLKIFQQFANIAESTSLEGMTDGITELSTLINDENPLEEIEEKMKALNLEDNDPSTEAVETATYSVNFNDNDLSDRPASLSWPNFVYNPELEAYPL